MKNILRVCSIVCILIPVFADESFVVTKKEKKVSAAKMKESIRDLCAQLLSRSAHTIEDIARLQILLMQRLQELLESNADGVWSSADKQELVSIENILEQTDQKLKEISVLVGQCCTRCQPSQE